VFEGLRAYGGRVFKLASHLDRLWRSAEAIRLVPPFSREEIAAAMRATLAANDLADAYIRLVITRGVGTLGLHPFKCPRPGCFIVADHIQLYPAELYRDGMKVVVAQRPRIPVQCLDPAIKSLNYLNNILAKIEAIDADVLEAIMLNTEGWVAECTGVNIFVIDDGAVFTPPAKAGVLHGITRQFVMDTLCPSLGIRCEERMMRLPEVLAADEVFLTGTAAEIIGISRICVPASTAPGSGEHVIGSGRVGPISARLEQAFRQRVARDAPED